MFRGLAMLLGVLLSFASASTGVTSGLGHAAPSALTMPMPPPFLVDATGNYASNRTECSALPFVDYLTPAAVPDSGRDVWSSAPNRTLLATAAEGLAAGMCRLGSVSTAAADYLRSLLCDCRSALSFGHPPNRDQVKFDFSWDATRRRLSPQGKGEVTGGLGVLCSISQLFAGVAASLLSCSMLLLVGYGLVSAFIQQVGCVVAMVSAGAAMALRRSRVDLCMLALTITCMPNFCLTWLCIRVLHRNPNNAWFVCLLIVSGLPIAGAMNSGDEFFADDYFEDMAGMACGALMHGVTRRFQPQTPAAVPSAASDAAPETHEIAPPAAERRFKSGTAAWFKLCLSWVFAGMMNTFFTKKAQPPEPADDVDVAGKAALDLRFEAQKAVQAELRDRVTKAYEDWGLGRKHGRGGVSRERLWANYLESMLAIWLTKGGPFELPDEVQLPPNATCDQIQRLSWTEFQDLQSQARPAAGTMTRMWVFVDLAIAREGMCTRADMEISDDDEDLSDHDKSIASAGALFWLVMGVCLLNLGKRYRAIIERTPTWAHKVAWDPRRLV